MTEVYAKAKDERAAARRKASAEYREAGPLPDVVDVVRRNAGLDSLATFALTYFPERFPLPFSPAHDEAIARLETCTNDGGKFACAMPRGSGKTTLAEVAVLRALLYGLRRFVVLVAATEPLARRALGRLQRELETNDRLRDDFPEVCHLVRRLEHIPQRAKGQTLDGEPTRMEWTAEAMVFPTVPGSPSSGAAVLVAGMTGSIRGLNLLGPDGRPMRPDLVVIDDAQTRESAKSPTQTNDREAMILQDVCGLAGPTTAIAAVMLCTVIYPNDLSDRFLDPEKHPEWRGVRTRMLDRFPDRIDLWDEYHELRRADAKAGATDDRATAFYRENRDVMDGGAVVTWPERKKPGELSGLQSAMNEYYRNPRGFRSEYQNEPDRGDLGVGAKDLNPAAVAVRTSGTDRFVVPRSCSTVTAFIDCGKNVHWYAIVAWTDRFGGTVIDYGAWPRQFLGHFNAADARPKLADVFPGFTDGQLVHHGLLALAAEILGRTYPHEQTGGDLRVERCLVDCGYESNAVYEAVRRSPYASVIYPAKGIGRSVTARGVAEWKPRPGERSGWHWRLTKAETGRGQMVQHDPDTWKSLLYERLTVPVGGPVALTFFGNDAHAHAMIADHCGAEYAEPVTLRGATFDKWQVRPDAPDNHLWDCLTGAMVAASVAGVLLSTNAVEPTVVTPKPPPVSLKALQVANRAKKAAAAGSHSFGGRFR